MRESRLRFRDKGTPNSEWTGTARATVAQSTNFQSFLDNSQGKKYPGVNELWEASAFARAIFFGLFRFLAASNAPMNSESQDTLKDAVWRAMLDADLNLRYWNCMTQRYHLRNKVAEIFLAVTSSSTVAAWAIWQHIEIAWKLLSGISTVVAVVLPILNWKKEITILAELRTQWAQVLCDYELLWLGIKAEQLSTDRISREFKRIRAKVLHAEKLESHLKEDKKLASRCEQEVLMNRQLQHEHGN